MADGSSDFEATLYNSVGQAVLKINDNTLNTYLLENGIYFLQIEKGEKRVVKKVLISR